MTHKFPRLVLRDRDGHYCINGLADPSRIPALVTTPSGSFKLSKTTPTLILFTEVVPTAQPVPEVS